MDFAYHHPSTHDEIKSSGQLGRAIFDITSSAKQSQSARQRIALIAEQIEQKTSSGSPITIASFAAGHARELQKLSAQAASNILDFIAFDSDQLSLDEIKESNKIIPIRAVSRNVIKDDLSDSPSAEIVYSLGLFDYLNDDFALAVLVKMWGKTKQGGICIVANLAPTAANLGYCEAIMDWWMIARSEANLRSLSERLDASVGDVGKIAIQQHGCFNYLRLEKK
jgi:extracellular factor (EF) 3-hydroxypalmitic acid methyl ester biosynthesis protein